MERHSKTRQRLTVWATAFLCASWYLHAWQVFTPGLYTREGDFKSPDYVQFYVMGSLLRSGAGDSLYTVPAHVDEAQRRIGGGVHYHAPYPNYGPQVALAFVPLASLPFGASLIVFSVLSMAAYATAVWWLLRSSSQLIRERWLVGVIAAGNPALLFTLRFGQLSAFSLLAIAAAVAAAAHERRFVAGLCLGMLAFKPQLLVVAVPALALAGDWRGVSGIAVSAAGQLILGWHAAGTEAMHRYGAVLWQLASNPDLVVLSPDIAHSLRGFLRLLGASETAATVACAAALVAAVPAATCVWRAKASALMRMAFLVTVTLLVTPHLITYDLLLAAVPFMAVADWRLRQSGTLLAQCVTLLLIALYFAPFSPLLAIATHVQLSTVIIGLMTAALWRMTFTLDPANGIPADASAAR